MTKINRLSIIGATFALLVASSGTVYAQSKMQCQIDHNGIVTAPLIWQNTLGADKANSICRSYVSAPRQSPTAEQMATEVLTREFIAQAQQQGVQNTNRTVSAHTLQRFPPDVYARATADQPREWTVPPTASPINLPKSPQLPNAVHRGANNIDSQYVPLELSGAQHKDDGYISMW